MDLGSILYPIWRYRRNATLVVLATKKRVVQTLLFLLDTVEVGQVVTSLLSSGSFTLVDVYSLLLRLDFPVGL